MTALGAPAKAVVPHDLSRDAEAELLKIVRSCLAAPSRKSFCNDDWVRLGIRWQPEFDLVPRGVFVTLRSADGQLRGCIGNLRSTGTLAAEVAHFAVAAAYEDPRFPPVAPGEIDAISIHVSVLGPDRAIVSPDEIELGLDGVVLDHPDGRAVFLPEVALEAGWDRSTLLDRLARKAGLAPSAWRSPEARLFAFRTTAFGEEESE